LAAAEGPTPEDRPHTALSLAAMKGHTSVVKALLDSFRDFNDRKDYVSATFHSAAEPFQLQPAASFAGGKDRQAIVAK
jgi:hypothetical protein